MDFGVADAKIILEQDPKLEREPTDFECESFAHNVNRTGLDPLARQIYAQYRWNKQLDDMKMSIQANIDGLRIVAQRTGEYEGQTQPEWLNDQGQWVHAWNEQGRPIAARAGAYRKNFREALYAVAHWGEFNPGTFIWSNKPALMIHKCAEAQALRRTFPHDLSGIYVPEELENSEDAIYEQRAQQGDEPKSYVEEKPDGYIALSKDEPHNPRRKLLDAFLRSYRDDPERSHLLDACREKLRDADILHKTSNVLISNPTKEQVNITYDIFRQAENEIDA